MKWYSEDHTKMIDLGSVNGFVYFKAEDYKDNNTEESDDMKMYGDKLEVIIGGSVFVFRGDQAKELFNLLLVTDNKELLKG